MLFSLIPVFVFLFFVSSNKKDVTMKKLISV